MRRYSPILIALCLLNARVGASELADPTRPSGSVAVATETRASGSWLLNATRITPTHRSAVINGTKVTEGGDIQGARVLRISHAQVQLQAQGEILTLELQPNKMKKAR